MNSFMTFSKAYLELCQTSMMELFWGNSQRLKAIKLFLKKFHRRHLAGLSVFGQYVGFASKGLLYCLPQFISYHWTLSIYSLIKTENQRFCNIFKGYREREQWYEIGQQLHSDIFPLTFVGNKAKGRISKWVLQENKVREIFRKTNIPYPADTQGVKNVRFSENLTCFIFL